MMDLSDAGFRAMEEFAAANGIQFTYTPVFDPKTGDTLTFCGFDYPAHWSAEQRRAMAEKVNRRFDPEEFAIWEQGVLEKMKKPNPHLPEHLIAHYRKVLESQNNTTDAP